MEIPSQNIKWKKIFLWAENWLKVAKDNPEKKKRKKKAGKTVHPHPTPTTNNEMINEIPHFISVSFFCKILSLGN